MYIHSSYLDCDFNKMPKNILNDYLRLKEENKTEYENIVLGGWITEPEGILLPKSSLTFSDISSIPEENIVFRFAICDPADKGGDKFSMIFVHVSFIDDRLAVFVKDVIHSTFGIEANTERIPLKAKDCKTENLIYETNGVGLAAALLMKKKLLENHNLFECFLYGSPDYDTWGPLYLPLHIQHVYEEPLE